MNALSQLQLVALAALVLSPLGLAKTAIAAPGSIVVPTLPINSPGTVVPQTVPRPTTPTVVIPTYPSANPPSRSSTVTTPGKLPPVPTINQPSNPPSRPVYPNSPTVPAQNSTTGLIYRVVVPGSADAVQTQVKKLVPQAFRTLINGQNVMQAGIFREQDKALELLQLLSRNNLQATVLPTQAGTVNLSPPLSPSPGSSSGSSNLPSVSKTGKIIVIDPGHGGGDPGAVGVGGLQEKDAVLDISRQVVSLLKQQGVQAILTRPSDEEIDLEPRVQFAERANADVFVSIHANSFDSNRTDVNGIETYYYSNNGQPLARMIQDALLQDLGAKDRGIKTANFYVIKYTPMPAALVEIGFVTGAEDAARLSNSAGRTRTARAIARGILQYIR